MTDEEVTAIVDKWTDADEARVIEKARVCNFNGTCYLPANHKTDHVVPDRKPSDVFADAFENWKSGRDY